MRLGQASHRVEFQSPQTIRDSTGGVRQTWSTVGSAWAKKLTTKGREYFAGATNLAATDIGFELVRQPFFESVDQSWRIVFESKLFDVYHVEKRDKTTAIICRAGVTRGQA